MDDSYRELYFELLRQNRREQVIMSNTNMEPSDRIILVTLERLYPGVHQALTPIACGRLAEQSGTSSASVTRFLRAMYESGYIDYRNRSDVIDVDGKLAYRNHVQVQLLGACKEPGTLSTKNTKRRIQAREQDRLRKQCKACGGALKQQKYTICTGCGEVSH